MLLSSCVISAPFHLSSNTLQLLYKPPFSVSILLSRGWLANSSVSIHVSGNIDTYYPKDRLLRFSLTDYFVSTVQTGKYWMFFLFWVSSGLRIPLVLCVNRHFWVFIAWPIITLVVGLKVSLLGLALVMHRFLFVYISLLVVSQVLWAYRKFGKMINQ